MVEKIDPADAAQANAEAPAKPSKTHHSANKDPKDIGVRDLLEAGLHFGHQTKRWNPKMKRYIFDKRNGIHIIDLAKSLAMLKRYYHPSPADLARKLG